MDRVIHVIAELGYETSLVTSSLRSTRTNIIGFDDIPEAAQSRPSLSIVRPRMHEIGATAVKLLLSTLAGEEIWQPEQMSATLIPRYSAAE